MAKQSGDLRFTGRIGDLIFYEAFGKMLVRKVGKSGSCKEKKEDKKTCKKKTNEVFEKASLLVKPIYAGMPKDIKKHGVFGRMTGIANSVLQNRGSEEDAKRKILNSLGN